VISKNKEISILINFSPRFPGNYTTTLNIKHSDGVITCLIFTEAFYADLRMIELDGKLLIDKKEKNRNGMIIFELEKQKKQNLNFLECDYDKQYEKTVTFKNFTNQTLSFEWVEVKEDNQIKSKYLIEDFDQMEELLEDLVDNEKSKNHNQDILSPHPRFVKESNFLISTIISVCLYLCITLNLT
jgi:CRISPR/Cas system-associated protein endoribonuclease Cas2